MKQTKHISRFLDDATNKNWSRLNRPKYSSHFNRTPKGSKCIHSMKCINMLSVLDEYLITIHSCTLLKTTSIHLICLENSFVTFYAVPTALQLFSASWLP